MPRSVALSLTERRTERVYRRYAIEDDAELHGGGRRLAGTFPGAGTHPDAILCRREAAKSES